MLINFISMLLSSYRRMMWFKFTLILSAISDCRPTNCFSTSHEKQNGNEQSGELISIYFIVFILTHKIVKGIRL